MNLAYYLGDSYSKDRLNLITHLAQPIFKITTVVENSSLLNFDFMLYSPTVDGREKAFLQSCLKQKIKLILLLDHNHFEYADFKYHLDIIKPALVITPQIVSYQTVIFSESLYLYEIRKKIKINTRFPSSLCFISQPLGERDLGFSQVDLLRKIVNDPETRSRFTEIYFKPHPREDLTLPEDLKAKIKIWESDIDSALSSFKFFCGYNSLALLGAQSLGHEVNWLCPTSPLKLATNDKPDFQFPVEQLFQKSLTILSAST